MKATERKQLEKLLKRLHQELTQRGPRRIDPNRVDEADIGTDEDEQPLNEMMQAIASNRNRNDAVLLQRVERALAKLKENAQAFGECEECGEEIGLSRLKAMPYAELCVDCQAQHDPRRDGPTRRKLTDYVD